MRWLPKELERLKNQSSFPFALRHLIGSANRAKTHQREVPRLWLRLETQK